MSEAPANTPGPTTCHQCGEHQLGSANRCWKCGTVLINRFSSKQTPTVHGSLPHSLDQRAPFVASRVDDVYEAEILEALVLDDESAFQPADEPQNVESPAPVGTEMELAAIGAIPVDPQATPVPSYQQVEFYGNQAPAAQRPQPGNPFQLPGWPAAMGHAHAPVNEPVWMPGHELFAARGGAVAALLLGVMAIIGGYFTAMAMFNALIGIVLGIWGMTSQRKRTALVGIVLCIIGFVTSMLFLALRL